jgi:hypothetical protein
MAGKKAGTRSTPDGNKRAAAKKAGGRTLITSKSDLPAGYRELLEDLKTRVRAAQLKAAVAVHRELIQLYWDIGRMIVVRQEQEGWGKSVVERLADDIQQAFPGLSGFSRSNVFRMRAFYEAYAPVVASSAQAVPKSAGKKVAQAVPQLPSKKVAQPVRQTDRPSLPDVLNRSAAICRPSSRLRKN